MLLLFCCIFHCDHHHYQDFDAVLEKILAKNNLASNSELRSLSFDDGLYWTSGIEIVSKSLELDGNNAGLTHGANVLKDRNDFDEEATNGTPRKDTGIERWMMEVRNSSLTMRSWRLDAGMKGTSIVLIHWSSVEVFGSEILSNMECSGFVLADVERSGSSRIVIVGSSHKSSSRNIVLPLVGRVYGQLNKNNEEWMGDEEGWSDGLVEMEEIIGVGLSFDSTHFALGTGPLFSFTGKSLFGSEIGVIGEISTELGSSDILNVTSTVRDGKQKKLGDKSCVWERVVGSRISGSTNHDMGTGLCGTRLGFNVVCVNSSFSSCVRTSNTEIDMKHENITDSHIGRTEVIYNVVTSVQFTLCTFNNITIAAGGSEGGSAICLKLTESTLTINQCFFHSCTSLRSLSDGGAVYVSQYSGPDCPIALSLSSFTECAVAYFGGSVCCESPSTISISDCFFEKSKANHDGGSFDLSDHSLTTLSNCAFVQCYTNRRGGAVKVFEVKSIDFSFLQFRGCSSLDSRTNDIYFMSIEASLLTALTVRFSDSTSGLPNVFLDNDTPNGVNLSHLVPQLLPAPTVTVEVSVSFDADNATVTATASEAVKGAMGILLNGSNVPRLVNVEFGTSYSSSKTGTAVVSSGADGILPIENYQLRNFSVPGSRLLPESEPAAFEASLEWTDDRCVEMVLKLMGQQLPADSTSHFIVTIASSSVTFVVTFINNNSGQSDPFVVTPSFNLDWEQEYRISSIEEDVPSDPQRIFCLNPVFTVPTPPHLTSARVECAMSQCTSVRIVFEGEKLSPDVPFITKISDTPLTLTTTFSSPTSGQTEPIDVWSSNPFPLSGFTIASMEEKNADPPRWVDVDRIPTIVHDAMITGVNCTLDNTATTYIIQFFSIFVISSDLELELQDDANNTLHVQAFLTDGVLTATEVVYPTSPNNLIAGRTYTVVSSNNATIKIRPSLNFTTPLPPKVLSASAECANVMCTTMNIVLRGQALLANRTFLLILDGIEEPMQFSCETQTIATIGPVRIGGGLALKHSTTYTLLSIVEDTATDPHRIHCDDVTFTTPSSPPLSTVHVSSGNGEDWLDCGDESNPCKTMEHALSRLDSGMSIVLLEGTFNHVTMWEISFSSLEIARNAVVNEGENTATHATVRVGEEGGLVLDGATETSLDSLSFVLPSLSAVEVYAEIKTGILTVMNCVVTGDVSTSSLLSARHPSFVRTRNGMNVTNLTTTQLSHHSVTTILAEQSFGLTRILNWGAESIHTQSIAGSAVFFTLSNTSSLNLSSSSFTSCSSSNTHCLGGSVSFSLSGSASLVIQYCLFVSCSAGDGGRGGGIGLSLSPLSTTNYLLDTLTFAHNTATFGRDLFLVAESLEKSVSIDHFLLNLHPPGFDRSNALFGSDRVAYVEETDLFPFLFPNTRFKNVFIDSLGETGQASDGADCGRETHPCQSLHDSMDHLLNGDSEEEVTQGVLERSIVLMSEMVLGEEDDVELCGYVTVGQQAGLVLSILPIRTHKRTQTDPIQFGKVRFTQRGSIGCRSSIGLSEIVPPQTVLMKHLEFVLPLFSMHPRPIIAVQSVSLSLIDCVVKSIDPAQAVSSLLSFHTTLTSMSTSVHLRVSHLVAQNMILATPLISIRSSADLPLLMDSMSTGHSSMLSQTLPFSLPPSLSITNSFFDCISLQIDATHENPIQTGCILYADLSLPLSKLSIRDCSFSSCCTIIVSIPAETSPLSSLAGGVCCFSLARSHLSLIDSCFVNCSFLLDPSFVVPHPPSLLALTSHTLAVRFLPSEKITTLASPLSAANIDSPLMAKILSTNQANPSFLFDDTLKHSPLSSHLELVGVEMEAGSSLDPLHPLPLALFVSDHSKPSLSTRSCVFHFGTADPLNVGLAIVGVPGGAWPAQRNMLFVNCTSSRREES